VLWYFSFTLFFSALLLFLVEPLVGKMILPLLGGTPAVWNTCLVFFQAMLLLGYLYAHVTSKWLSLGRQVVLHVLVLGLPLVVLPIDIASWGAPPADSNPVPWLLLVLTCTVGPAFFMVSASAPILQRWFAGSGHAAARDPYFLYAASNLGSMIALLGYPALVEPRLPLGEQSWIWLLGYAVLALLVAGCGLWAIVGMRQSTSSDFHPTVNPEASRPLESAEIQKVQVLTWGRRMRWLALSAVPSSLLLGFTNYLTTDIAAIPLLWVVPLAIYLLTFILVFARKPLLPHWLVVRIMPLGVLTLLLVLLAQAVDPFWLILSAHLVGFFLTAMLRHGELAADRPDPMHLTEFYLLMSVGGVLGGLFNALAAPLLFDSILEYPLMLVAACFLVPRESGEGERFRARALLAPLALAAGGLLALLALDAFGKETLARGLGGSFAIKVLLGILAVCCFPFCRSPLRFGLAVSALFLVGLISSQRTDNVLYATRSFFGVHRVIADDGFHKLVHGNTSHGMQNVSAEAPRHLTPLSYYHPTGPLGQVFAELKARGQQPPIAIVGLGSGSIASYLERGQSLTYYEIDPSVVRIAQTPDYFTFLAGSKGKIDIVLGDGRLTLAHAPDQAYGLIVVDAFSSDAIPLHLITREAVQLYLSKLAPGGVLAFHISNRYLNLEPVLGDLAGAAGVECLGQIQSVDPNSEDGRAGKSGAHYVVLSKSQDFVKGLALRDTRWRSVAPRPAVRLWTDDFSNILSVLKLLE
jgi:spermidine synthase